MRMGMGMRMGVNMLRVVVVVMRDCRRWECVGGSHRGSRHDVSGYSSDRLYRFLPPKVRDVRPPKECCQVSVDRSRAAPAGSELYHGIARTKEGFGQSGIGTTRSCREGSSGLYQVSVSTENSVSMAARKGGPVFRSEVCTLPRGGIANESWGPKRCLTESRPFPERGTCEPLLCKMTRGEH